MDIKPIHNEDEYALALGEASAFFENQPEPGTSDGDRFELLLMVIESYEAKHHAIAPPDPIDAIEFRMEQAGLTVKDLVPMIGQINRVYEIMARKTHSDATDDQALAQGAGHSCRKPNCRTAKRIGTINRLFPEIHIHAPPVSVRYLYPGDHYILTECDPTPQS